MLYTDMQRCQCLRDILQERFACARERDSRAVSEKEGRAHLGFEALQRHGEGGLLNAQLARGTGEVLTARDGLKVVQIGEVHGPAFHKGQLWQILRSSILQI